jgi:hypothetical protein
LHRERIEAFQRIEHAVSVPRSASNLRDALRRSGEVLGVPGAERKRRVYAPGDALPPLREHEAAVLFRRLRGDGVPSENAIAVVAARLGVAESIAYSIVARG